MEFALRLPRNAKEMVLFIGIISILSVNIIAPLVTGFEVGFSWQAWGATLQVIPWLWLCVVVLVVLTQQPAQWMANKLTADDDSFSAKMIITELCNVFLVSIFLTVIGTWIGGHAFNMVPIIHFFEKWPRNFAIAFAVEAIIAQPIARTVMAKLHQRQAVEA